MNMKITLAFPIQVEYGISFEGFLGKSHFWLKIEHYIYILSMVAREQVSYFL